MKTLLLMLGLAFLASPARAADLQYWVDEYQHKIYFVARPQVAVSVSNVAADDDYWDLINVDVSYSNPKMDEYLMRLKARYAGYELNRLILNTQGDFRLTIPVLLVDETVKAMPGVDGPWMHWQGFIQKSRSEAVRRAVVQAGAVAVSANAGVAYRLTQVLERVELGTEICQEIAPGDRTLFASLLNFAKVLRQVDARAYRYPETRTALIRSVLESCLDLPADASVGSWGDLLDTRVELRSRPARPFAETRGEVPTSSVVPLQMDTVVTVGGRS